MAQCQPQQQLPLPRLRRRCRCRLVIDQYSITITITITPRVCGKLRLGKVNEKCVEQRLPPPMCCHLSPAAQQLTNLFATRLNLQGLPLLLLLRCLFANSIAILCSSGSPWRMSNVWPRFRKLSLFMLQQQLPPTTREIQCTFSCTLTPLLPPLCCTAISLEGISKFRKIKLNFTQCVCALSCHATHNVASLWPLSCLCVAG